MPLPCAVPSSMLKLDGSLSSSVSRLRTAGSRRQSPRATSVSVTAV